MNPQQMQQVRTISQEQFQPFLQQHKILIEELSQKVESQTNPHANNIKLMDERIMEILEQENKIKMELQKENDNLRQIIDNQKQNFSIQQTNLNEQVTTLLNQFTERIQSTLDNVSKRVDKLESGEISVSLPTKDIANAIQDYYQTSIKVVSVSIATLTANLLDLNEENNRYESLQKSLRETEQCIHDDMNPIILQSLHKTVDDLTIKIELIDINQTKEKIRETEEEISQSKTKLEQLRRHHL